MKLNFVFSSLQFHSTTTIFGFLPHCQRYSGLCGEGLGVRCPISNYNIASTKDCVDLFGERLVHNALKYEKNCKDEIVVNKSFYIVTCVACDISKTTY